MLSRMLALRVLIAVAFIAFASQPCSAQQIIYGAIESLDTELGTITVLLPPKHEPKQFNLAKPDLPTTDALGKPLKVNTLREKQRVALTLDEADDVAAIRVDDNVMWAYALKIDPKEQQLDIKYGRVDRKLEIPAGTPVLIDGEKAALTDLKAGQGIKAIFAADQQKLLQIQAGKGISGVSPYHRWINESGILLKVDQEQKKFQMVTTTERIGIWDYDFYPDAILRLAQSSYLLRTTDVSNLHPYCKISFYYESDSKKVVQVTALVPNLTRKRVEAIDREKRTVTIMVDDKMKTLPVADDAMIRNGKGLTNFGDVEPQGLINCGLTLDCREIVYLYVWPK